MSTITDLADLKYLQIALYKLNC